MRANCKKKSRNDPRFTFPGLSASLACVGRMMQASYFLLPIGWGSVVECGHV